MRSQQLLQKTEIPEQELGEWKIEKFEITQEGAASYNLSLLFEGYGYRAVHPGHYTRLGKPNPEGRIGAGIWMSDTPAELNDHYEAAKNAYGHCLIAGLGLGIIVEACLRKEEVTKVTVLEIEPDIIKMVGDYLIEKWGQERLEFIQCDALEWKPPKGVRYGMCWFDIWPSISQDNWDEYKLLHRRYGQKAEWKGSWGRHEIQRMNREDYENSRFHWGW